MWSDTLLAAEREHLLRLIAWSVGSILVGTASIATLVVRRVLAPIVRHFAVQMAGWGAVELALLTLAWRRLEMRDVAAATRLDRIIWFTTGLELGIVAVGVALMVIGWLAGRRVGLVGAGAGTGVQGLALAVINLHFTVVLAVLI